MSDDEVRVIRLRMVPWDVAATIVLLGALILLLTTTSWPSRLFAFVDGLCVDGDCPPAAFGANYYVYPVMYGGIGAAVAAATLGPLVSLVKGWLMFFWPIVAAGVLTVASVLGYTLAGVAQIR